jgi:hypothetical protein
MEMEALTVRFRGNEYASSSCIGKQEIEGSKKCSLSSQQRTDLREWLTELTKSEGSDRQCSISQE